MNTTIRPLARLPGSGARGMLVFDIHGVLLGRREPAGHRPAGEVLARLRSAGYTMAFVTNGSSVTQEQLAAKLQAAGVQAEPDQIVTAAMVMAERVARLPGPRRLFAIGSDALREQVSRRLQSRAHWVAPEEADTVLVSRDPALCEDTLERLRRARAPLLLATCRDARFPSESCIDIGPGPTVDRVEAALGLPVQVVGKPDPFVLTQVLGIAPAQLRHTVVVGDSPEQDVALARRARARSVLLMAPGAKVPTGPETRPDHAITALDALWSVLELRE